MFTIRKYRNRTEKQKAHYFKLLTLTTLFQNSKEAHVGAILGTCGLDIETIVEVTFKTDVLIHEHEKSNVSEVTQLTGKVLTISSPELVINAVDPAEILAEGQDASALTAALELCIFANGRRDGDSDCRTWRFGKNFLNTAKEHGFLNSPAKAKILLRSCSESILKDALSSTHKLRINQGGNSPQVSRKGDLAWRRDIDYTYHLHYWELPNGNIEFASVVVHEDMTIPTS